MRKLLVSLLALLAFASSTAFAGASTWTNVTVTQIQPQTSEGFAPSGTLVVTLSAAGAGGSGNCGAGANTLAVVDLTTIGGAFVANALQTARLTGGTITVYGTGSCTTVSTIENIASVKE